MATTNNEPGQRRKRRTFKEFIKKYLWEGQALKDEIVKEVDEIEFGTKSYQRFLQKHRRLIGIVIPAAFFHFLFWSFTIKNGTWYLFKEHYTIAIVAIFGSLIAGMTSEGGGSVAFPIMTLALSIKPVIAKDFTLMVQSTGMTAASFSIYWMKIYLEVKTLIFCTFGGIFGIILSLEVIDERLSPAIKKMGFVSLFFTFAFALFLLNRIHKRTTFKSIPEFNWWKAIILIITGFFGGIFTGIAGNGIDICTFSVLTLFFRVTEKTATPTSVVLMAINSIFGAYWRIVMMGDINPITWEYIGASLPIGVILAPLGSVIGSHFHRQTLACLNYITDTTALVSGFAIVPLTNDVIITSVSIIVFGFVFYGVLTWLGGRLMNTIQQKELENKNGIKKIEEPNSLV